MYNFLNSPLLLSIIFPALTVIGTAPLLRWALSGRHSDVFASLNVGLACMIAVICAYGRPDAMLTFGPGALPYAVGGVSLISLIYCLYVANPIVRVFFVMLTTALWSWLVLGGPLNNVALEPVLSSGLVLVVISYGIVFRNRWEMEQEKPMGAFISLSVAAFALSFLASWTDMTAAHHFAIALCVIGLGALVLSYPRFGFSLQENALLPLSLCVATLLWMVWQNDKIPVMSLICVGLIFFARPAVCHLVKGGPQWLAKSYYMVLFLFCLLPAFLAVLFYDVLQGI